MYAINERFERTIVLTQNERPDRLSNFAKRMRGYLSHYEIFYALPESTPFKSFCISQASIIRKLEQENASSGLVLEDDLLLESPQILDSAIAELPGDWDLLQLGCNLRGVAPEPYSSNLCRLKCAWMTHAVAYSAKGIRKIAKDYEPEGMDEWQMYDDWLSNRLPQMEAYVCRPMIAHQVPGKSDLWGTFTDYSSTIDQGNLLML